MNICFNMPVNVIMKEGCVEKEAANFTSLGEQAIVIVDEDCALNSARKDVTSVLNRNHIPFTIFDCVQNDPIFECARKIAKRAKKLEAVYMIAIGGECALNSGKVASLLAAQDQDLSYKDLAERLFRRKTVPLVALPTAVDSCSEVTSFPILTTQDNRQKIHLNIPEMYATVALIDPGYLTSFQDSTMIDPALNTICRAVEAMITVGSTPLTRAIAKESLSGMSHVLMDLLEDSLSDASLLPYNSVIAGIAVSQTGVSGLTGLSYSLAAHRRIPRGRAAGLLMIPYLRFVMQSKPALVDEIVEAMALRNLDDLKKGIDVLLGKKLAFTENEINLWADEACALHDISSNGIVIPTREEYLSILQNV